MTQEHLEHHFFFMINQNSFDKSKDSISYAFLKQLAQIHTAFVYSYSPWFSHFYTWPRGMTLMLNFSGKKMNK